MRMTAVAAVKQAITSLVGRRLVPLGDRILVERLNPVNTTAGGIMIPEKAQEKIKSATVIAVGPGRLTEKGTLTPMSVKEGDVVLLPEFGGTKVEVEKDKELFLFRDSEILGKWAE